MSAPIPKAGADFGIQFRTAALQDIPRIRQLAAHIWRFVYPGLISDGQIEYMLGWMYSEEKIRAEMEQGISWILVSLDGDDIGYLTHGSKDSSGCVELHKVYLVPALHGKGIASRMLAYVETIARQAGATKAQLGVNKKNERAIKAYTKSGFVIVRSVLKEIGNGYVMDDYVMEKRLAAAPGSKAEGQGQ